MSSDQSHDPGQYEHEQYGQQGYGVPQPAVPQQPYESYAYQEPYQQQYQLPQEPHQDQGPVRAQTWQGQTWDTQYQPQIQPQQPLRPQPPQMQHPQHPQHPQSPQPQHQAPLHPHPQHSADETAYLPPQTAAHPLPPEVPSPAQSPAAAPVLVAAVPDSYSPPTTMGNARITDAQRARAEGRSPIIAPGVQPAGLTAVLGLLLAAGAAIGPYALLVPLVILQAVTAAGWFRLNGMWPARQGIALAFAGGLTADIALLAVGEEHALAAILGTLGAWVLLTVVLQLRSHAGADERMQGLMATLASASLAILATGLLAADPDAVTVGALAVAAATVVRALPLPAVLSVVVASAAGAGAGFAAGGLTDLGGQGALLGVGAGVCALIGLRVASYDYPSRFVHMTAGVALPLTVAAPAVYLLGRALSQ